MKIAVCDNNLEDRARIRTLLEKYRQQNGQTIEIREYPSGEALWNDEAWVRACQIVFWNIEQEGAGGLRTARQLKESYPDLYVILVSGRMSDALEGYRVKAERFLMKAQLEATLPECLDEAASELAKKDQKISFSFVEGERCLDASDILYIETDRHKNIFHTTRESYRIYQKLDEIERLLAPYGFVRVHRSFLVNMRYIRKISSYILQLSDQKCGTDRFTQDGADHCVEISVPKSRYAYVKREYAAYQEKRNPS